jgi:hypothetical protein
MVARLAERLGEIEDDRQGREAIRTGEGDEGAARLLADVGSVDHGESTAGEPLAGDEVQELEGIAGGALVVLIIGDQGPAVVGGDHLGRPEMEPGEGRLPGA